MQMTPRLLRTLRPALAALMLIVTPPVLAEGTLTHLSGPVSIQQIDGKTVPATIGTKVLTGQTVLTGEKGYARMEMTDGGEMVLRPDSQLKIEAYKFNQEKPAEDSSVFSMIKGGLRKVTGMIGKRGNQDAYKMVTPTATIGIRGTQFDLRICQGNCGALANGTYLAVRFGAILASNPQGSLTVPAGQFVHVPPSTPPVVLPRDPGIGFTPPTVIPKLDEKKKLEQQKPEEQPAPNQQSSGQSSSSNTDTPTSSGASQTSSPSTSSESVQCSVE